MRDSQEQAPGTVVRGSALLLTNVTKLVGLGLAVNEGFFEPQPRNGVIALCALFVLGTQVAENVLLRFIERLFSKE